VGNFTLSIAGLAASCGLPARVYAYAGAAGLAGMIAPIGNLADELGQDDVIFYNYSTEDEFLPWICSMPGIRKVLYYHNLTPGHWFRESSPEFADALDRARGQFPQFAAFDAAFANSNFSLQEILPCLRPGIPAEVFPPCLSFRKLAALSPEPLPLPASGRALLWVGRMAPHKRPEMILELFQRLHARLPDSMLVMVGGGRNDFAGYAERLDKSLASLPENVKRKTVFLENISDAQLAWLYRTSSPLLSASAHEGFGLPLAEAMSFGLPVAAFRQEAVEETLAG
jgi:glycosyltransferase involved in cell wall biosynthesis